MKVVQKAIVPAAGLGRRVSPISKVLPKEMFPIGSHPAIEWVIAEAVRSGCTDVAVVLSPSKRIIQEYLETCCPDLSARCHLTFLVQPEALGLGHALWLARDFCAGHPFAVLLPDDLVNSPELPLQQMETTFEAEGGAVFALVEEPAGNSTRYGRWQLRHVAGRAYKIEALLGRTAPVEDSALLLGIGRYLLSPECLDYAESLVGQSRIGELDDGLIFQHMVSAGEPVHGVHIQGRRYDISTADGYIAAWQRFGQQHPDRTRKGVRQFGGSAVHLTQA